MNRRRGPVASGLAAVSHGKLVLLLTLTAAVLGALAALPLTPALHETMVETLAGDHFLRNHPAFAPSDFLDFLLQKGEAVVATRRSFSGAAFLGVLLQIFYTGGIVAVLDRGPFSFGQFLEPARRNFWHNVKCFFLFALIMVVVLGTWLGGARYGRSKLLEDVAPDAAVRSMTFWILAIVGLGLFAAASLFYDFARAARRFSPQIGAWRAYQFARRALSGSWMPALGLWILWFALGGAAVLGLFAATWRMRAVSLPAIGLQMLMQLGVLWLRSAARVAAWGSYVAFLETRAQVALSATSRRTVPTSAPGAVPSG